MKCIETDALNIPCGVLPLWDIYEIRKYADIFMGRVCKTHLNKHMLSKKTYHFKWIRPESKQ